MSHYSLVPLIAVVFAPFRCRCFLMLRIQLRYLFFANFMPATGDVIQRYIEQFVANSNKMTAVGACGLIVTALLLMYAIDSALNTHLAQQNAHGQKFLCGVPTILTLGPLAGASSRRSALPAFFTLGQRSGITVIDNVLPSFRRCSLVILSFWLLTVLSPTTRVPNRTPLSARLSQRCCSRPERKRFALYITMFPSYQLIYGVLAASPSCLSGYTDPGV
ncbi:YihY family inner membrane protein [Salmonella enterica subsp. enterica]|nr:YihY family inner membrane protein [Salmonella enterica subsp. enterica]